MRGVFLMLIAIFCSAAVNAQYTDIINSKRPGFSESPYGVGAGVYQIETGFFYRENTDKSYFAFPKTTGGTVFLRFSKFSDKLEINANITFQDDDVKNIFGPTYNMWGISDLTVGAKFLLYQQEYKDKSKEIRSWKRKMAFDWKRLIPSVGIYLGVHTPFAGKDYKTYHIEAPNKKIFNQKGINYKIAALLQNDFSDRLVMLTNLFVDRYSTENEYYSYIVTITYAVNERWSYFVENQGWIQEFYSPKYQFGTGLAYLITPNLQIDVSARTNFLDDYSYTYLGTGLSWRLDKHKDYWEYKSAPKKPKIKKRGSFFSRLFKKKN